MTDYMGTHWTAQETHQIFWKEKKKSSNQKSVIDRTHSKQVWQNLNLLHFNQCSAVLQLVEKNGRRSKFRRTGIRLYVGSTEGTLTISALVFFCLAMRNFYIVYPLPSTSNNHSRNEQRIYENTGEGTFYNVFHIQHQKFWNFKVRFWISIQ